MSPEQRARMNTLTPSELQRALMAVPCPSCGATAHAKCIAATGKLREWCVCHVARMRRAWGAL